MGINVRYNVNPNVGSGRCQWRTYPPQYRDQTAGEVGDKGGRQVDARICPTARQWRTLSSRTGGEIVGRFVPKPDQAGADIDCLYQLCWSTSLPEGVVHHI